MSATVLSVSATDADCVSGVARALVAAGPGDTVAVRPGHYREALVFTRDVVLVAEEGPGSVVLEVPPGAALLVASGRVALHDMVLRGGDEQLPLVQVAGGVLRMEDCEVHAGSPAAVHLRGGQVSMRGGRIVTSAGAGIVADAGSGEFADVVVEARGGPGLIVAGTAAPVLRGCEIRGVDGTACSRPQRVAAAGRLPDRRGGGLRRPGPAGEQAAAGGQRGGRRAGRAGGRRHRRRRPRPLPAARRLGARGGHPRPGGAAARRVRRRGSRRPRPARGGAFNPDAGRLRGAGQRRRRGGRRRHRPPGAARRDAHRLRGRRRAADRTVRRAAGGRAGRGQPDRRRGGGRRGAGHHRSVRGGRHLRPARQWRRRPGRRQRGARGAPRGGPAGRRGTHGVAQRLDHGRPRRDRDRRTVRARPARHRGRRGPRRRHRGARSCPSDVDRRPGARHHRSGARPGAGQPGADRGRRTGRQQRPRDPGGDDVAGDGHRRCRAGQRRRRRRGGDPHPPGAADRRRHRPQQRPRRSRRRGGIGRVRCRVADGRTGGVGRAHARRHAAAQQRATAERDAPGGWCAVGLGHRTAGRRAVAHRPHAR
ncbi:hypothetical protein FRACA_270026 [Frankia canadensis]|uniref:Right handed beta helix domain-containing protein n=1 Tax=Frankia canadensis TaxID=1836972 RepID=A0A2I2KSU4_9ACTN|nr:hypothetical protein FRACA_270026 [Frankia canadensis]SOU55999.1 hypothetical protein FRACA_270026 [Frankia canadensis]